MHDDDLPETRLREQNSEYHYHNPYTPSGLIRRFTSGEWRLHDGLRKRREPPPPPTRIIIEDKRESSLATIVLAAFFGTILALMFALLVIYIVVHLPER